LWQGYRPWLDSKIADMNNAPNNGYAGAITAALYLESFVENQAWMHLDLMGWNPKDQPGRPMGGEAMTIRALYSLLQDRYG
jgi:leucyl aminopeptidase